jgi:hypothetical protein
MNIPRRFAPAERKVTAAPLRRNGDGADSATPRAAGIRPAQAGDDLCRHRCSSIRNDSSYNLCMQLCRHPAFY